MGNRGALVGMALMAVVANVSVADVSVAAGRCESGAAVRYDVPAVEGDATQVIQAVIDAAVAGGERAEIRLAAGATYHVYRGSCRSKLLHISNTTSERENPDHTKYIAMHIEGANGLTINGDGAKIVTHGELTTFAIEESRGVTLKDFTLDAADPSVPEFRITEVDGSRVRVKVTPPSRYEIAGDSTFYWTGEGWRFTEGLAQVYFPDKQITWRYDNPIRHGTKAVEAGAGEVDLYVAGGHPFREGEIYQMRHTIRNQVCGFINESEGVRLEGLRLQFVGNFGVVSQNAKDITVVGCRMAPDDGSGRTCAGFADFLQFSGCRGYIEVDKCYFAGAHDDAINVHGTHLKVVGQPSPRKLRLRYMHDQTWGFNSFYAGDSIEVVDVHSLKGKFAGIVEGSRRINDYEWEVTVDRDLASLDIADGRAVENISATPSLRVADSYFTLVPTRGILVTTRRKVVIEGNTFDKIPMPAIYISDDARGWYESGPVRDVTIRRNRFIECGSPVIGVKPETDRDGGAVHSGIRIEGNEFVMRDGLAVSVSGASDVVVEGNVVTGNHEAEPVRVE